MAADCYPNILVAYWIINYTSYCNFSLKKFLKTEVVEQLFEINYVTRKIKWLCNVQHREGYIRHYLGYDFALAHKRWFCIKKYQKKYLLWANGFIECKYMIIKLILEVQINYCFSLQHSPIIIKHVKCWKNARQFSRVFSTR